jgi:hypothetical protein
VAIAVMSACGIGRLLEDLAIIAVDFADDPVPDISANPRFRAVGLFTPSSVIAILNPATILSFFVAFAALEKK